SIKAMQMHDPLKEVRESIRVMQMHDPLKEVRESIKAMQMHDPLKEVRESMKAVRIFGEFVSNFDWTPEIDGKSGIEIIADGTLIINSKIVTQERVQEIAQSVISKAINDSSYAFEQKINKLIQEIRALKDPVIQSVIAWLIYPLIVGLVLSVINPVTDFYIKERLNKNEKKLVVKEVSNTLNKTFNDQSCLSSFRIVSATSLNIRKSSSSKSDIIATLFLGDVVEIIKKEQKWFLISWRDAESDTSVQGWAYSQYLKTIK
ncbi:MAG: SH3 domain-containing protein, partial [Candidatus Paceibacterota bacterium]